MKKFITDNIRIYLSMQYRLNRKRFLIAHIYLLAGCLLLAALMLPFTLSAAFPSDSSDLASDALSAVIPPETRLSVSLGLIMSSYAGNFFSWSTLLFAASLLITVGRLYDLGKSCKYLFIYALPFVNIIFFFYLCCKPGTPADNEYGFSAVQLSDAALLSSPGYHVEEPINTSYSATFFEQILSWRGRLNRQRYVLRNMGLLSAVFFIFTGLTAALALFAGMGVLAKAVAGISDISFGIGAVGFIILAASVIFFAAILLMIIPALWKIRRWHDLGHSGYYLLLTEVPYYFTVCGMPSFSGKNLSGSGELISFILIFLSVLWLLCVNLYLIFIKGTDGSNMYGTDPLSSEHTAGRD